MNAKKKHKPMTNTLQPWGMKRDFILASGSKQRLMLLKKAGFTPSAVISPDIDETQRPNELPARYVYRIALEKARAVAQKHPNSCILSADTIVTVGRRFIRKAETAEEARANLELISGRRHRVLTGFCVITPEGKCITKVVTTAVVMKKLDPVDIDTIIASDEWVNVCGYQIEGVFSALVKQTIGSYPNVVGLPIFEVAQVLRGAL